MNLKDRILALEKRLLQYESSLEPKAYHVFDIEIDNRDSAEKIYYNKELITKDEFESYKKSIPANDLILIFRALIYHKDKKHNELNK
jgi:hypothetical protein